MSSTVVQAFKGYSSRKAISKGLLDAALFISNVSQLKSILDGSLGSGMKANFAIGIISFSMIMQVVIGILLIMILDIEGAILQLEPPNGTTDEVTALDSDGTGTGNLRSDARKTKLLKRARRINTAILCFIFLILILNIIINVFELGKPSGTEELEKLLKSYNITRT